MARPGRGETLLGGAASGGGAGRSVSITRLYAALHGWRIADGLGRRDGGAHLHRRHARGRLCSNDRGSEIAFVTVLEPTACRGFAAPGLPLGFVAGSQAPAWEPGPEAPASRNSSPRWHLETDRLQGNMFNRAPLPEFPRRSVDMRYSRARDLPGRKA